MALTDEKCKQNDNISTTEIEQDINETQREIDQYQKELNALMGDRQGNKLAIYMREGKILQRKEFVSNLNSILEYRKALA
jgi:archaellum component FlaC